MLLLLYVLVTLRNEKGLVVRLKYYNFITFAIFFSFFGYFSVTL